MGKRLLGALLTLVFLATTVVPALAQTAGQGLEISPPLVELDVDPGTTQAFQIRLRNITQGELVTKARVDDFVAQGEQGQPKLLTEENAEPTPYTFKPWVAPIADVTIAPQEQKTITVTLNVPKDASPGGHYGVIRFTGLAPGLEDTGVSLSASIGTLVLLNVSGPVVKDLVFEEFFASQNGEKKGFFEKGPITFVERLKNKGTVHLKPLGTLRITNMFGKEVAVLAVNENGGNILPASVRRFEQQLNKSRLFGKYNVEANIQYEGKNVTGNISFWVIPYKLIAIILGGLLIAIVALRKGLKAYNRRIIKKAQK